MAKTATPIQNSIENLPLFYNPFIAASPSITFPGQDGGKSTDKVQIQNAQLLFLQPPQLLNPVVKDKKYLKLESEIKLKNSRDLFTDTHLNDSDVIFDHIFINKDGDKEIPGDRTNLLFDNFNNEFILPTESNFFIMTKSHKGG